MIPSGARQRQTRIRQRLQRSRGAQILCCVAGLLLLVSQASPARHQLLKRRRLGEDSALSAALNGLPVSPSASSGISGVNVYGLDNSLLAALQGNNTSDMNSTHQPFNRSQSPIGAPASQPTKAAPVIQAQFASSQSLNTSIGPAMAPQGMAALPHSNVTPLDPLLAAALENQGRVSAPAIAPRAPYGKSAPAVAPASIPSLDAAPPSVSPAPEPSAASTPQQVRPCNIAARCTPVEHRTDHCSINWLLVRVICDNPWAAMPQLSLSPLQQVRRP